VMLNDLVFERDNVRLNPQFRDYPRTADDRHLQMNRELSFAYWEVSVNDNAKEAPVHLESVGGVCRARLSEVYRQKYTRCIILLRKLTSPVTYTAPGGAQGDMGNLEHLLAKLEMWSRRPRVLEMFRVVNSG